MSMKKLLRRGLAAAVLVTAMAGVISSAASASDSLRMSDARQAINRLVRHKARDGYEPGSMVLFCSRRSSRYFSCDLLFSDDYGDAWCGHASARLRGGYVYSAMKVNQRGCEDF